jgi:hypothetical protein
MRRVLVFLILVLFLAPVTARAFDGARKGFVLGGGLGLAPHSSWSLDFLNLHFEESQVGVGVNVVIGYAWDEMNMIVYEVNATGYNSDYFRASSLWSDVLYRRSVSQGFSGAAWYHYFGPMGKSFFTTGGLGLYVFDVEGFETNDPGVAVLLGGGYEFARHFQVGLYLGAGSTSSLGVDFNHSHINILVSAIAF